MCPIRFRWWNDAIYLRGIICAIFHVSLELDIYSIFILRFLVIFFDQQQVLFIAFIYGYFFLSCRWEYPIIQAKWDKSAYYCFQPNFHVRFSHLVWFLPTFIHFLQIGLLLHYHHVDLTTLINSTNSHSYYGSKMILCEAHPKVSYNPQVLPLRLDFITALPLPST